MDPARGREPPAIGGKRDRKDEALVAEEEVRLEVARQFPQVSVGTGIWLVPGLFTRFYARREGRVLES